MNVVNWWLSNWWLIVIPAMFGIAGVVILLDRRETKRAERALEQLMKDEASHRAKRVLTRVYLPSSVVATDGATFTAKSERRPEPGEPMFDVIFQIDERTKAEASTEAKLNVQRERQEASIYFAAPNSPVPPGIEMEDGEGWELLGTTSEGEYAVDNDFLEPWLWPDPDRPPVINQTRTLTCLLDGVTSPAMMDFMRGEPLTLRKDQHP